MLTLSAGSARFFPSAAEVNSWRQKVQRQTTVSPANLSGIRHKWASADAAAWHSSALHFNTTQHSGHNFRAIFKCRAGGTFATTSVVQTSVDELHAKVKERENPDGADELTSVNCRGQTPTLSPDLASIQFSSRRRMTVRMSPCEPELRAQAEQNPASVRKGEPHIKWTKGETQDAELAVLSKEGALSSQSLSCSMWHQLPLCLKAPSFLWPFDHLY